MSVAIANPVLVQCQQPAAAKSKNYRVELGFRPAMIFFWNNDGSNNLRPGLAYDGIGNAGGSTKATGYQAKLATNTASGGAWVQLGSDGITINDDGFEFGQDAAFKDNSALLSFLIFRSTTPIKKFDLADVPVYKKPYGDGTQYKENPTHSETIAVYEV